MLLVLPSINSHQHESDIDTLCKIYYPVDNSFLCRELLRRIARPHGNCNSLRRDTDKSVFSAMSQANYHLSPCAVEPRTTPGAIYCTFLHPLQSCSVFTSVFIIYFATCLWYYSLSLPSLLSSPHLHFL